MSSNQSITYVQKGGDWMSVEQRVQTCRLLEKMKEQEMYSKRLGLEDMSTVHGMRINKDAKDLAEKG